MYPCKNFKSERSFHPQEFFFLIKALILKRSTKVGLSAYKTRTCKSRLYQTSNQNLHVKNRQLFCVTIALEQFTYNFTLGATHTIFAPKRRDRRYKINAQDALIMWEVLATIWTQIENDMKSSLGRFVWSRF